MVLHIHLDAVGGLAGDMFVGCVLDAWPELADGAIAAVRAAGVDDAVPVAHRPWRDDVLCGSRFVVEPGRAERHDHVHWHDLRQMLGTAPLENAVKDRAIAIFALLAQAEAHVHGVDPDQVAFHEVGAVDSIADIVAAAWLIQALGPCSWSIGALPLGGGRVATAHGDLPVPAPATVFLLEGYRFIDDGRGGERVTPTGAAILRHLAPRFDGGTMRLRLCRNGIGFGSRHLMGMSNIVRLLAFKPDPTAPEGEEVGIIEFEIDDQTAEDLALALERLRALEDVLDVLQIPAFGKKNRLVASIRIITRPNALDEVARLCLLETTTLGLRLRREQRFFLARTETAAGGAAVKLASRPDGTMTAKAAIDDFASIAGHGPRKRAREAAERQALEQGIEKAEEEDRKPDG